MFSTDAKEQLMKQQLVERGGGRADASPPCLLIDHAAANIIKDETGHSLQVGIVLNDAFLVRVRMIIDLDLHLRHSCCAHSEQIIYMT